MAQNETAGHLPKKCFLYDDIHRIVSTSRASNVDRDDKSIGVKRIKSSNIGSQYVTANQSVSSTRVNPRLIAPATLIGTFGSQSLQPDFQSLDTGQEKRFTQFNDMIERHHKEKMEALDQILELLTKN